MKQPKSTKPRREKTTLINNHTLDADAESKTSDALDIRNFRKFLLYVSVDKMGDPADSTIQIILKFHDISTGTFVAYMNGPFGYFLVHEDQISAAGTPHNECVSGECLGNYLKVTATAAKGTTLDASNYFKVTAEIETVD